MPARLEPTLSSFELSVFPRLDLVDTDLQLHLPAEDHERNPLPSSVKKPPLQDPPHDGLQAWLVVLGCWCVFICSFGWINCIRVFQEYYARTSFSEPIGD